MKFLHTSDIHYGATPDANKPWGRERAQAIKAAFENIISTCAKEDVNLLLIAGDLFDSIPTDQEIDEVNKAFASIPNTKVAIIPGKSDEIFAVSPVLSYEWAGNVTYVAEGDGQYIDDNLGILMTTKEGSEIENPEKYVYIALGGNHKPSALLDGRMANSGSPEPVSSADTSKHGYYIGEIDEAEKKLSSLKFITLPTVGYISLVVNVTPETTNLEVVENIKHELERRGTDNIYRIRLKGMCNPEAEFDLSGIKTNFKVIDIIDQTEPKYDYASLFAEHSDDMVGFFIKEMNKGDKTEMQQKALAYGINALLKTTDERK